MTRVRQLDVDHDWTFGKGQNDYLRDLRALVQSIDTRLNCFLGQCFFDIGAGIDWFNLLGSKDQTTLRLALVSTILNTSGVTGLLQLSIVLSTARRLTVQYRVQTIYSTANSVFQFNANDIE